MRLFNFTQIIAKFLLLFYISQFNNEQYIVFFKAEDML